MSAAMFAAVERWQPRVAPLVLQRTAIAGVSNPTDALEVEADHAAGEVVRGATPTVEPHIMPAFTPIQREEAGSAGPPGPPPPEKTAEEKAKEAAEKIGEALLETPLGKELSDKALKGGEKFVLSLPGAIITGAAVGSAASYIIGKNIPLPAQIPTIPLDKLAPGLKVKMVLEGPVQNPTSGSLTFTYTPPVGGGGGGGAGAKPAPTASEKFRAETARMAAEQAKFREGLKSPAQKAAERAEDRAALDAWLRFQARPGGPLHIPGLKPGAAEAKPKKEEAGTVQRKAESGHATGPLAVPPRVRSVAATGGAPLDPAVRSSMERGFGRDFAGVRVHADQTAANAASAVHARAYTLGDHVVFDTGQYLPSTLAGRRLIAHELAHVVQQGRAGASR